ncbi:MAG: hypothetical protein ACYTGL_30600, partial [Planctomycetota bacterium]
MRPSGFMLLLGALLPGLSLLADRELLADDAREIRFNRDVRPILSTHCWACHGPDSVAREADLR